MLQSLVIQNIATIESVAVEFSAGFNVLTGETGAGKSIVVSGLEIALGDRVTSEVIRSGEDLAIAEALFIPPFPHGVDEALLSEIGIEYKLGENLTLRRELSRTGRNRCFINQQMVSLADLKKVGEYLVDLHGQHEHQSLLHISAQRVALDAFAGNEGFVQDYKTIWEELTHLRQRKKELEEAALNYEQRLDFLSFQIDEIEKAAPQPGEIEELEIEEQRLARAESLSRAAAEAAAILEEGVGEQPISVISQIGEVIRRLYELAEVEKEFENTIASFEEARILFQDLARTLQEYSEKTFADPKRLDEVITRLELLRRLVRKHGGSQESLFAALDELREQCDQLTLDDEERQRIVKEIEKKEISLKEIGEKLSKSRNKAAVPLKKKILSLLKDMALDKADFQIFLEPLGEPSSSGMDNVELLLAANPGLPAAPLRKVASGGELSRVMLAIKSALAEHGAVPTLVFDEIDAGISGETCRKIAGVMERLSNTHQILCITHQAAIAARARTQYSVCKTTRGGKTFTELVMLEGEERLEELARMIGDQDSRAALSLARQLMKR